MEPRKGEGESVCVRERECQTVASMSSSTASSIASSCNISSTIASTAGGTRIGAIVEVFISTSPSTTAAAESDNWMFTLPKDSSNNGSNESVSGVEGFVNVADSSGLEVGAEAVMTDAVVCSKRAK